MDNYPMLDVFFIKFQRVKQDYRFRILNITLILLIGLIFSNQLLLCLLGLPNTALPWSFIDVIRQGFVIPTLIAFTVVYMAMSACFLWWEGGIKRAIAQQMLFYGGSFLFLSTLGLALFIYWEQMNFPPYPWLIVSLFLRLPEKSTDHLIFCLLASYSLLFMMLIWKCFSVKTNAEKIFGHAHFANAVEIKKAGLYANHGLILGKAYGKTLKLSGFEGALVVAPTGSGKTTAIAIPNLLEWTDSGVFNDLKGELYRLTATYRKNNLHNECFLWAPADIHKNTSCYNPFFYVSDHPDLRIRDLQLIAETLIPTIKLGDGFWYQSSREIFLTLSLYLLESTGTATLSEIHDLSKQESFFAWLANEIMDHEEFSKPLKQNTFALLGADEKTQKNILKDFHSRVGLFNDPLVGYATSKNDFDFRELRKKKISIYIQIPDGDKERLSPILTLFWAQLIHVISEREPQADEPYGVLALMDEFGNMARINKLKDGLSFLRSYRMRCIIIVQYLAQIYSVYGRYDAKGFLNSKVKIAFALNDREDAKFFSESLGNKTIKVSSSSVNTSHGDHPGSRNENTNFQSRPLMTSDEIMQLSDKKAIILMEARNPIKADKCYWFKDSHYRYLLSKEKVSQEE
jgi:type IV secretion system protein VirD4